MKFVAFLQRNVLQATVLYYALYRRFFLIIASCGGFQTGSYGTLLLPASRTSKSTEMCIWNIKVQDGQRITLETRQLDLGMDNTFKTLIKTMIINKEDLFQRKCYFWKSSVKKLPNLLFHFKFKFLLAIKILNLRCIYICYLFFILFYLHHTITTPGSDCSKSFIIIREGLGSQGKAHPKICGSDLSRVSKIISTGNAFSVEVYANCMCDRRQFRASWRIATEGITYVM